MRGQAIILEVKTMSISGTYQVTIKTPEETIEGTLTLKENEDQSMDGSLVTGDHRSDFTHGNIFEGKRIAWVMQVKTTYVMYNVDCTAIVDGDSLKGEIRSKTSGFFGLEGKKVS
jgi:hypothetical protein